MCSRVRRKKSDSGHTWGECSDYSIDDVLDKASSLMDEYNYELAQKFCQVCSFFISVFLFLFFNVYAKVKSNRNEIFVFLLFANTYSITKCTKGFLIYFREP